MLCSAGTAGRVFGMVDDRALAGDIMAGIFKVVGYAGLVATGVAALASFRSRPRLALALLLFASAAFSVFFLNPKIEARQNLETWHGVSTALWMGMIVGGSILAAVGTSRAKPPA
jgi:hypothetical protein